MYTLERSRVSILLLHVRSVQCTVISAAENNGSTTHCKYMNTLFVHAFMRVRKHTAISKR